MPPTTRQCDQRASGRYKQTREDDARMRECASARVRRDFYLRVLRVKFSSASARIVRILWNQSRKRYAQASICKVIRKRQAS
jgi:hypothetical protein